LSLDDVLDVRLELDGTDLTGFSIQYRAFMGGEWRAIVRYDTSHGRFHVHRAWRPEPEEHMPALEGLPYKAALRFAEDDLRTNWGRYRGYVENKERKAKRRSDGHDVKKR
jgi:hypothetical protein